jgi:hypothetical protein
MQHDATVGSMNPINKPSKPGNVKITPVGHTYSGKHGSNPNATVRGGSKPTEQTFGK